MKRIIWWFLIMCLGIGLGGCVQNGPNLEVTDGGWWYIWWEDEHMPPEEIYYENEEESIVYVPKEENNIVDDFHAITDGEL